MFARTGSYLIFIFQVVNEYITLLINTLWTLCSTRPRLRDVIQQFYYISNQSLWIIVFCVSFASVVIVMESAFHMKLVIQNDALVPGFATLLILRELGVILAALLLTSRVGAGITAEVGSMKITEQIDALKMLNIDPIQFIVVPRFIACAMAGICLTIISNATCLVGAMLVSHFKLGYTYGTFLSVMNQFIGFNDLILAIIKGAIFGAVIPLTSCYFGLRCQPGAEGVGMSTTNSVVASSVAIIVLDFILSWGFSQLH